MQGRSYNSNKGQEPAAVSKKPQSIAISDDAQPYQNIFDDITNCMTTLTSNNMPQTNVVSSSRTHNLLNEITNLDQEII